MADPILTLTRAFESATAAAFGDEHENTDPALRRSNRADFQANVALALGKRLGKRAIKHTRAPPPTRPRAQHHEVLLKNTLRRMILGVHSSSNAREPEPLEAELSRCLAALGRDAPVPHLGEEPKPNVDLGFVARAAEAAPAYVETELRSRTEKRPNPRRASRS